jgi:hypothetical protein
MEERYDFPIIFYGSCISSSNITERNNSKHHHENFKRHSDVASVICAGLMGDGASSHLVSELK